MRPDSDIQAARTDRIIGWQAVRPNDVVLYIDTEIILSDRPLRWLSWCEKLPL